MESLYVNAWEEKIIIPTYETGKPEKNPLFFERRVYQGSSGVVYPNAVIEIISDEKKDKEYNAVFLENEYLKIMILPELGGRIQRAFDKIQKRDFVYYNQVIKPALVGLTGPWISGGIEFNWPQHHRPSTFEPIDYKIEENEDGSATVWVNEVEKMFRMKGSAGFTLYPGKAYLEVKGKVFNPTTLPQTFLWWANPAVKVDKNYQSIFPPDVYAVFDHGKREVSDFPIATGTYYKVDYAPGTDISRYETIPVPTSYMAIASNYDFIGCYEHDSQAGMLHVADHHFSPGKKQWTWGNGDFGRAWDRHLTDKDGPYIELMTGVYTDNQPDFTWLMPNEEKTFEQYFMPFAKTGGIKNASKEALINVLEENGHLKINVYTTAVYEDAKVKVYYKEEFIQEFIATISPEKIFHKKVNSQSNKDFTKWKFVVEDRHGKELIIFQQEKLVENEIPPAASAAKAPEDIIQIEELYLNGLHLEQYRHATYNPVDYYKEGLRRSPADIRCNNALGLLLMRRGQFIKAAPYFKKAIKTLTNRNPNPYESEPYFNLGVCLKLQGKQNEAYDAFYKAVWNDSWQHAGYLQLAKIKVGQKDYNQALYLVNKSLIRNYNSNSARHVKAAVLRKLHRFIELEFLINESLDIDLFNSGCLFEKYLMLQIKNDLSAAETTLDHFKDLMRNAVNNYLELSLEYANAGLYEEAESLMTIYIQQNEGRQLLPMCYYYAAYFTADTDIQKSKKYIKKAATLSPDYVFPNKVEEINILQKAIELNPEDAKALYFLGNLWYDKRQYDEAIACWEKSATLDEHFPTVLRNLSLAYYNKRKDPEKSLKLMEEAFALDASDARILMELDQLYKMLQKPFTFRLELLEKHMDMIEQRDDLYLERVTLYNNLGNFAKAKELLSQREFHPWEGGEGKVITQFILCHTELAKHALANKEYFLALELLTDLDKYPENLGEGKLYTTQENDLFYLKGLAYAGFGKQDCAMEQFHKATKGIIEPVQAIYYNDPQPDKMIYQGFAWIQLNHPEKAKAIFKRCIKFGDDHYNDKIKIDYFAVSLPDLLVFDVDLALRNKTHCQFLVGLGNLGLENYEKAKNKLEGVIEKDHNHQGAASFLRLIPLLQNKLISPYIS